MAIIINQYVDGATIAPNDTQDLPQIALGLFVGGTGDIKMNTPNGTTLTLKSVTAGIILPVMAKRILQGLGVATLGAITGGSLYTNGTYNGVALTGSATGSGATANITVAGGAVTAVTIVNPGSNYKAADALTAPAASIGGTGSGFSVPVATVQAGTTATNIIALF